MNLLLSTQQGGFFKYISDKITMFTSGINGLIPLVCLAIGACALLAILWQLTKLGDKQKRGPAITNIVVSVIIMIFAGLVYTGVFQKMIANETKSVNTTNSTTPPPNEKK